MKTKLLLGISVPILAILVTLLLGQMLLSRADYGTDFRTNGTTLQSYSGTDAVVTVPSGITQIGREAFAGNPLVEEIVLPNTVTAIDYGAFSNCVNLKSIEIPESVVSIGDSAFNGCANLKNVTVGKGLKTLGTGVFAGCSSLQAVKFDALNTNFVCRDGVVYSQDLSVLYQYLPGTGKPQYRMPDEVREIKRYAFWGCDYLEDVILSNGLERVAEHAFSNSIGLKTVTVNSPVREIAMGAFENCTNLLQVSLPISVSDIHGTAFTNCPADMVFICENDSYASRFAAENGILTAQSPVIQVVYEVQEEAKEQDASLQDNETVADMITERDDVVYITDTTIVSDRAFIITDNLRVVTGDAYVAEESGVSENNGIAPYAYYNDKSLTVFDMSLYTGITEIGALSFARTSVEVITIPEGVETIGYGAFYHCDNLEDITIPDSVTTVAAHAFEHTPWLEDWYESSTQSDFLIVGDGVLIAYKGSDSVIHIPEGVTYIAGYAFYNNTAIAKVILSDSVETIDSYAFYECSNLNTIENLGNHVKYTTESFAGCPIL